ncbi:GDSL-type esterase/lipase family protein [Peribacillus butanolivorans]|uniref:GDSL-type esterase/lipase family protein n=1 Tax=Peribacillus sp. TH16 TaxID=2798482 RepID=UPI001EEF7997|nr:MULTISPECIES: GDSL-type esterase/lipase family protein [Peribacillus]MCO0598539.1 GDSL-type esterase/lipase family protein [Peribacillus butanolivorans]MED3691358.1 GDSL-type esterase/lipase family protein [Peribacillus butanolivorans]WMX53641.1 GDSL-type esterase/lipase family protein [Peribacillus sp. R9-11]
MLLSKTKVLAVTVVSVVIGLFFLFCLGWAIIDYYGKKASDIGLNETNPIEKNLPEDFTVVALGDSLTRGTGDETGKGYVGLVVEDLESKYNSKPLIHNLGINGQVSQELVQQVKQTEVKRQLHTADVILITIGGNDLFQQGQTLFDYDLTATSELQENYLENLNTIFKEINNVNDKAAILLIGLYNPFIELDEDFDTNRIVRDWNNETAEVVALYKNAIFVPTFDLFQLSVNDYLYSDKFHPNKAGYRLIADRVAPLIQWEDEK